MSKGEFIWFLDGDDWIIYPDSAKQCIKLMRDKNFKIIRIEYVSNYFNILYPSMVWQYIYRRSLIDDISFSSQ